MSAITGYEHYKHWSFHQVTMAHCLYKSVYFFQRKRIPDLGMHDMHERSEMIRLKYVFLGNLNAPIHFRYNLNSISWFCILTIYFNTLVICIMINIFFPAESPPCTDIGYLRNTRNNNWVTKHPPFTHGRGPGTLWYFLFNIRFACFRTVLLFMRLRMTNLLSTLLRIPSKI